MSFLHPRRAWNLPASAATPESVYVDRRRVIAGLGLGGLALALGGRLGAQPPPAPADAPRLDLERLTRPAVGDRFAARFPAARNGDYGIEPRPLTPERIASRASATSAPARSATPCSTTATPPRLPGSTAATRSRGPL